MKKCVLLVFSMVLLLAFSSVSSAETIRDIFPDENVARYIRDEIGAITVDDEVTQEKLDEIWHCGNFHGYGEIHDMTGVSRLHGCTSLAFEAYWQEDVDIASLPPEMFDMAWVTSLKLTSQYNLREIPSDIEKLQNLTFLSIENCAIESLPDSICNLANLEYLSLSGCPITSLPENIGNLTNLKTLDISDTKITALPDSIKNLTNLDSFSRSGTPL